MTGKSWYRVFLRSPFELPMSRTVSIIGFILN